MAASFVPKVPPRPIRPGGPAHFRQRGEPGLVPAAIFAVLIHGAFFALIVFGVSWQVRHPEPVVAELWSALPPARNLPVLEAVSPIEAEVEPAPVQAKPVIPPVVEKVAPVPFKADLELKAKREEDAKAKRKTALELMERKQREEAKAFESRKLAEAEKRRRDDDLQKRLIAENQRKEQEERENAARAANSAAVREYGAKIAALVRSRANIPDTVSGKPVVQLRLRLLVNGVVFDAQVIKPSGNRVYDEAVERAINGIRQWPLPESAELFGGKRELTLNIEHER